MMKRFFSFVLVLFAVPFVLSACGAENGADADLVFVNGSDATISAVLVSFEDRSEGTQNADGSPLKRGESLGFEAGEYPAAIAVYEVPPEPFSDIGPEALASTVIGNAPPEGERWYVTARDGGGGIVFTVSTQWPEGVPEAATGGGVWMPSGTLLVVVFLAVPLVVLAALCVMTLNNLEPQRRRGLFALFFTMLGLALVLFGGAWALDGYGLAWRTWFQEGLSLALGLVGLVTGILTVVYAGRWVRERHSPALWTRVLVLSLFCLVSAMFVGTVLGVLWAMGPGEQVVTYDGQTVILGTWTWMGESYELYEYHGPLVRGVGPMLVDWDESLIKGAVNVPW